ncbi:MAG: hypothetical protein J7K30_13315 [Deltaproteobacteria bacterium]|nr:hypothetical protein [Deltaproteobacteria bacterium]
MRPFVVGRKNWLFSGQVKCLVRFIERLRS